MGWEEAGRGWGARAVEWAYLLEPYSRPANELLFDKLAVGSGVRLLDVACGSGFAAQLAARRGAMVAGLDAAESLIAIARMPYFLKVIELSPSDHGTASMEQGDTGRPGVVEGMLAATGFDLIERGVVTVVNEWPDVATAVRALAAAGPSVPAITAVGYGRFCEAIRDVIAPINDERVGIRISSEFGWVTATTS